MPKATLHDTLSFPIRNVMRDVTRLLYLLNKKSSVVEIPPDGIQLLSWSEQILQRYLASQVTGLTQLLVIWCTLSTVKTKHVWAFVSSVVHL